jgi:hypothetical protein
MSIVAPTDRTVDADLLVDVPQLSVEELTLELEASVGVNRLKLDAKGLHAGLYLKGDFENLQALAQKRSGSHGSVRSGLRELLGGTRDVIEHVTPSDDGEQETEDRRRGEHDRGEGADGAVSEDGRHRVRHVVGQGAKAAGLTAAGVAGGALLEARVKPSSKLHKLPKLPGNLPLPRRRSRAEIIRDEVLKRLPTPS